jgi:hypothetical protein
VNKSMAIAVAAIIFSLSAVACGTQTTTATTTSTATSDSVTPADGNESAAKAGVGDTLSLQGWDGVAKIEVTLTDTHRLPAATSQSTQMHPAVFGVLLTIKNVGENVYSDYGPRAVVIVDNSDISHNGSSYLDATGNEIADQLGEVNIAPGDKRTGWVYFPLESQREARLLQFTADSGNGSNSPNVGEWSLQ